MFLSVPGALAAFTVTENSQARAAIVIGDNPELKKVALGSYESVHKLIDDIERRKVKRR